MQQSFSVVEDDDSSEELEIDEQILRKYGKNRDKPEEVAKLPQTEPLPASLVRQVLKNDSAGPSLRRTTVSSDSDDEEVTKHQESVNIPREYDPKQYEHLESTPEMKEIFQYITKYIPQPMSLDNRFKPFIPEYLPAVGDIDAFLKIVPPATILGDDIIADYGLGLVVLDEPAANQSDSALLHLQLRAESVKSTRDSDVVVKTVDDVEKNAKVVEKWIKDVAALHKSRMAPAVRYAETMPDLDDLMQEWPESADEDLKIGKFPKPGNKNLEDYVDNICHIFNIPNEKNKIHSLHVFFSLYAAVKSSQLFKTANLSNNKSDVLNVDDNNDDADVDRLLLLE